MDLPGFLRRNEDCEEGPEIRTTLNNSCEFPLRTQGFESHLDRNPKQAKHKKENTDLLGLLGRMLCFFRVLGNATAFPRRTQGFESQQHVTPKERSSIKKTRTCWDSNPDRRVSLPALCSYHRERCPKPCILSVRLQVRLRRLLDVLFKKVS